jgi:monovalent cation/hydrogen antiporter
MARLFLMLSRRLADGPVSIVMQFVGTFAVWLLADAIEVSPILTVVVYAMTLARTTAQGAEARMASFAVWDVAIYVLNALAFVLMGLQLKTIARNVDGKASGFLVLAAAILATVILVRLGWVLLYSKWVRYRMGITRSGAGRVMPTTQGAFTVGWCGMRGIVTLATALALPFQIGGAPFPHRDLLVAAAFAVVLGTLVLQGLTLGPLLRYFKLADDGMVVREEVFARQEIAQAALSALDGETRPEAKILRKEYNYRLREAVPEQDTLKPHDFGRLRLRAINAERNALDRLRREQKIGDAAFQTVQEELDWAEGHAAHRKRAFSAQTPDVAEETDTPDTAPVPTGPDRGNSA